MTQIQRDQFNRIYQGTNDLIRDLCREGDYQDEFLKHSPCLQRVKPQHESVCSVRYQQTMSSIFKASANQTAHNQQQRHQSVNGSGGGGGEDDVESVKIVCW